MKLQGNKHVLMFSCKKTISKHMFSCHLVPTFTYPLMGKGLYRTWYVLQGGGPTCRSGSQTNSHTHNMHATQTLAQVLQKQGAIN